jgi:uracil-DNA glycosylase
MIDHRFSIQEGVLDMLQEKLFLPNVNLTHTYKQISSYHLPGNKEIKATKIDSLQEPFRSFIYNNSSRTTLAVDLPVLVSRNSNRPVVMICAMDALPPIPESNFWEGKLVNHSYDVGLGVPFSLVVDWTVSKGSLFSNLAFFKELLQHFDLYITDIYKLFFRISTGNSYINSNTIHDYTRLQTTGGENIHASILEAEIDIVQPKLIITLGSASRGALALLMKQNNNTAFQLQAWSENLQHYKWNSQIPWIASPHISNAANGTKKLLLQNSNYNHIQGQYANERLARIIIHEIKQHR